MAKILVIDNDPMVCGIITNCLLDGGSEAEWVACARLGAQMLVRDRFDLAVINGAFAEVSGAALAEIAANENTAVLLLCGDADTGNNVRRFGFPYLERPISLERLSSDATELIARSRENIGRVKTAAARMRANTDALEAASAWRPSAGGNSNSAGRHSVGIEASRGFERNLVCNTILSESSPQCT